MLRGSLCRDGPEAQEQRLWKPRVVKLSFGCILSTHDNAPAVLGLRTQFASFFGVRFQETETRKVSKKDSGTRQSGRPRRCDVRDNAASFRALALPSGFKTWMPSRLAHARLEFPWRAEGGFRTHTVRPARVNRLVREHLARKQDCCLGTSLRCRFHPWYLGSPGITIPWKVVSKFPKSYHQQ
jgi:hypothetical protein